MLCTLGRVFENYMPLRIQCITHKMFLRKAASRKRFLDVSRFAEARRGVLEHQATSYFFIIYILSKAPSYQNAIVFSPKTR